MPVDVMEEIQRIELDESSAQRVTWIAQVLKIVEELGLEQDVWRCKTYFT